MIALDLTVTSKTVSDMSIDTTTTPSSVSPTVAAEQETVIAPRQRNMWWALPLLTIVWLITGALIATSMVKVNYWEVAPGSAEEVASRFSFDKNIKGTLNILQAARRHDVMRVVQTSTSEVYGSAQYIPIDEVHPLHPQSPYAASKVGADQLALSFHASFNLPVGILRPFNTYGPRQSARAVIPTIISQLANKSKVKLGSLSPTRDFSFVQDTANGFLAAAQSDAIVGQTINLGSGFEISIKETAETIAKLMNTELELVDDEQRVRPENSEVERLHASIEKAKTVLGWQPQLKGLAGFETGLTQTIEWFSNPANLARYKADRYNL